MSPRFFCFSHFYENRFSASHVRLYVCASMAQVHEKHLANFIYVQVWNIKFQVRQILAIASSHKSHCNRSFVYFFLLSTHPHHPMKKKRMKESIWNSSDWTRVRFVDRGIRENKWKLPQSLTANHFSCKISSVFRTLSAVAGYVCGTFCAHNRKWNHLTRKKEWKCGEWMLSADLHRKSPNVQLNCQREIDPHHQDVSK